MSDILEVPPRRLELVHDVCLHTVTATDTVKPPYCPRGHEPDSDEPLTRHSSQRPQATWRKAQE
jgi:hypothetical protein